ncbi:putative transcriptional regulator ofpyridoxine metabolism [Staphylococcus aureus]|uniref:Putative transcriptional regulator ofpyridoxine metabolism n=1 Tax=Staphylococcus aureus TaxID=1280 RepID=A0A380EF74_STAAU|nr:putative transcriptional regulator ofpyridoxine metabolism [Staphylococcus aureus]
MKLLNHKKYSIYNAFPSISNWICDGLKKRTQLIQWAQEKEERFIIEDDYDSEFRYFGNPFQQFKVYIQEEKK